MIVFDGWRGVTGAAGGKLPASPPKKQKISNFFQKPIDKPNRVWYNTIRCEKPHRGRQKNFEKIEKIFQKPIDKPIRMWYNKKVVRQEPADKSREHSSAGRASALQAEGHRFEPCCSHQYGPVVQLVRTLACHARGQGFESPSGRHLISYGIDRMYRHRTSGLIVCLCSSVGRAGD